MIKLIIGVLLLIIILVTSHYIMVEPIESQAKVQENFQTPYESSYLNNSSTGRSSSEGYYFNNRSTGGSGSPSSQGSTNRPSDYTD